MTDTDDTLHPRAGNPSTSWGGIERTMSLRDRVLTAGLFLVVFNDTQLTKHVNRFRHVADRNVVARTRLSLEKQGHFERIPHGDENQIKFSVAR